MAGLPKRRASGPLGGMLKVDQVHVIRHKVLVEGRSQRQVAKELGISRLTVKKYLTEAVADSAGDAAAGPAGVGRGRRRGSRRCWPRRAAWTGGKQQLTATRLHELLVAEGHRVGVTLVKEAVAEWRAAAARGLRAADVSAGRSRRGRLLRGARRSSPARGARRGSS